MCLYLAIHNEFRTIVKLEKKLIKNKLHLEFNYIYIFNMTKYHDASYHYVLLSRLENIIFGFFKYTEYLVMFKIV